MSEESRGNMTLGLWFLSAIALVALFISAGMQGELTTAHTVLAAVILGLATIASPLLLRWKDSESEQEKTKRQRIDSVLSNMSDDDLIELKRRLSDVDDRPQTLADTLGDDGELVQRR